jgi:hypothetical protein
MSIAIPAPKSSRIRAAAQQHPELDEAGLARFLGLRAVEVRNALGRQPRRRIKSIAK